MRIIELIFWILMLIVWIGHIFAGNLWIGIAGAIIALLVLLMIFLSYKFDKDKIKKE
jgi:putative effector of murein hydrolase LrgA (UPF0299 family)